MTIIAATTLLTFGTAVFPVQAATESVLWSPKTAQYGVPWDRLLLRKGSLFGTTLGSQPYDGTVFELTPQSGTWRKSTLIMFDGSVGALPWAGLIADSAGTLYGTTSGGGPNGGGTVFSLAHSGGQWISTVLWGFGKGSDGFAPVSDLVMDASGNLYGTAQYGGFDGFGIVFELTQSGGIWQENILYTFTGGVDGAYPAAGLYLDKAGALYGTTWSGGAYAEGTAFELVQSGGVWNEIVLHSFGKGSDGTNPRCVLMANARGVLYGTTSDGGANRFGGVVFKLWNSNGAWKESVLHSFGSSGDGDSPQAGLRESAGGALYGTTDLGGTNGDGTVFEMTSANGVWSETVLHSFGGPGDGSNPMAAVIFDNSGNLYGTTFEGGAFGHGSVWELTP